MFYHQFHFNLCTIMFSPAHQVVTLCLWSLFGCIACEYAIPEPQVTFYRGKGLQVSIPEDPKISLFCIAIKAIDDSRGEVLLRNQIVLKPNGGRFAYVDVDLVLDVGRRVSFRLDVIHDGLKYFTVKDTEVRGGQSIL